MNWHLQDAKNNFSKLVQRARSEGPQTVTVRGEPAVAVLSTEEYEKLAGKRKSLAEYLLSGPTWDEGFIKEVDRRSKGPSRTVDL